MAGVGGEGLGGVGDGGHHSDCVGGRRLMKHDISNE